MTVSLFGPSAHERGGGGLLAPVTAPTRWLLTAIVALIGSAAMAQVELDPRVFEIASELRCPVCTSESVAQSAATTSIEMRSIIAEQLAAGRTKSEILAYFQQRYGDWILLRPPRRGVYLLVWWVPVAAGVALLAALGVLAARWLARGKEPVSVDAAALARVRQDLRSREERQ